MNAARSLATLSFTGPSPSDRFALIILGLCQAVAVRGARDRAIAPFMLMVASRLRRTLIRFEALVAMLRAGRLPTAPRPAHVHRPRPVAAVGVLPRGFAWLVRLLPAAAVYGSQLQHLLDAPEMAALLAAAPQAGRLLRPLCRMLAVHPGPAFRPPPSRAAPPVEPHSGENRPGPSPDPPHRTDATLIDHRLGMAVPLQMSTARQDSLSASSANEKAT